MSDAFAKVKSPLMAQKAKVEKDRMVSYKGLYKTNWCKVCNKKNSFLVSETDDTGIISE